MVDADQERSLLAEARDVTKLFAAHSGLRALGDQRRYVRAVDRVSLAVHRGEALGLVGESGCGKSTLGRLLIRLERPSAGQLFFEGRDITRLRGRTLRKLRQRMQIIFQDPALSLNPRFTVRETLDEALMAHGGHADFRRRSAHLAALLGMVGLSVEALDRLPQAFSGGERQRIAIARALAVEPRFIVADEPISSLDLASQAQIVDLLAGLRRELGVALLLITHNLEVLRDLCDRVAVMYLGRILEIAEPRTLIARPRHPYTHALVASSPVFDPLVRRKLFVLAGDPPSPMDPPKGCHFHPRCPHARMQCRLLVPPMREPAPGHFTKCHFDFDGEPGPPGGAPGSAEGSTEAGR
ncbi:MAG TPA: ABC transporter ATP-binding protein [Polyangia bacterium]|nr:ABC transporter ATP-binding protein [Polyangia bacterium]